ncbi:MAG: hypothetical protein RL885_23475 [Planctomycetota bacterium]
MGRAEVAIEVGKHDLRIWAAEKNRPRLAVHLSAERPLSSDDLAALPAELIRSIKGHRAQIVVDDGRLIHRTLPLPLVGQRRLHELARMELSTQSPNAEAMSVCPIPMGQATPGAPSVLLVAAPLEVVHRARRFAQLLGVSVDRMTTVPLVIAAATPHRPGVDLIVHMGSRSTWILALQSGRWLFSRRIEDLIDESRAPRRSPRAEVRIDWPLEGTDLEATSSRDDSVFRIREVAEEVDRTIRFLLRHHGASVERIHVEGELTGRLEEELELSGLAAVHAWSPDDVRGEPRFGKYVVPRASLNPVRSGLAVDLLFPQGRGRLRRALGATALLVLIAGVILATIWSVRAPHADRSEGLFRALEQEVMELSGDLIEAGEQLHRLRRNQPEVLLAELRRHDIATVPWLGWLSHETPETVVLETFALEVGPEERHWQVEGWILAEDAAAALELYHTYRARWSEPDWLEATVESIQPVTSGPSGLAEASRLRFRMEGRAQR